MDLGFNFFHYTLVREEAIVVNSVGQNWTPVPLSIDRPLLVCLTSFFHFSAKIQRWLASLPTFVNWQSCNRILSLVILYSFCSDIWIEYKLAMHFERPLLTVDVCNLIGNSIWATLLSPAWTVGYFSLCSLLEAMVSIWCAVHSYLLSST